MNQFAICLVMLAAFVGRGQAYATTIPTNWWSNLTSSSGVQEVGVETIRLSGGFNAGKIEGVVTLPRFGYWRIGFFVRTDESINVPAEVIRIFVNGVFVRKVFNTPPQTNIKFDHFVTGKQFTYQFKFSSPSTEFTDHMVMDAGSVTFVSRVSQQTPTGFYYPTGTDVLSTFAGWLAMGCNGSTDYPADRYHLGKDIASAVGDAVYAIADGEVRLKSVNGWGQNNMALIIRHALANGIEFFAVYGHIRSALDVGDRVKAGESFATIGPWVHGAHLHFGIHLGPTFPATQLGLMPCAKWPKTNGFVEPISWIITQTPGGLP